MRTGRATWADLAEELELTAPAIAQRVRRLEDRGVIRQFAAVVDPDAVAPVCAFVSVQLGRADQRSEFIEGVQQLQHVQECSHVAGSEEYLLKVRCGSLSELTRLVSETIPALPSVSQIRTAVVLQTIKETPVIPISV